MKLAIMTLFLSVTLLEVNAFLSSNNVLLLNVGTSLSEKSFVGTTQVRDSRDTIDDVDNTLSSPNFRPENSVIRRHLCTSSAAILTGLLFQGRVCHAGEVGAKITKAVTTSDLGVSVRTSVVKGAQVMDQMDGAWERFSDNFGLGAERSKQVGRPTPKVIPNALPLDVSTARQLLEISDQCFCKVTSVRRAQLDQYITKISEGAKPSFERSGVTLNSNDSLQFDSSAQFNFATYCHFKAFSDITVDQNIPFGPFRTKFEKEAGQQLSTLLVDPKNLASLTSTTGAKESFAIVLASIDEVCKTLRNKGLVALAERSNIVDDQIEDWLEDASDLEFSVALDEDATLQAQILLQEQGFRLYPNFARYIIAFLLQQVPKQKVSAMDYYFDTDYNSDPDKFEVKEVLLNLQLENL